MSENCESVDGIKSPGNIETMYINIVQTQTSHDNKIYPLLAPPSDINKSIQKKNNNNSLEIQNNRNLSVVCYSQINNLAMTYLSTAERSPPPPSPAGISAPTVAWARGHTALAPENEKQKSLTDIVII